MKNSTGERHKDLLNQGWTRRFDADGRRASEMRDYYESLGYEVHVEPGIVGVDEACTDCINVDVPEGGYFTIYTRGGAHQTSGELFD